MMRHPSFRLGRVFRGAPEAEVDEELQFHLDECARENIAAGMSPEAARAAALERFGRLDQVRDECSGILRTERTAERRRAGVAASWLDFKLGLRMLKKYPAFSIIGGLGIALGVAVSAGGFVFINGFVSADLPFAGGDRIVAIEKWNGTGWLLPNGRDVDGWREQVTLVEHLGAFRRPTLNLTVAGHSPTRVTVAEMTASGFELVGGTPLMGRALLEEDAAPGATPVVVISHSAWRTQFDARPDVLGDTVRLGATTFTVVGVMPEGFAFPLNDHFWTPLETRPSSRFPDGPERLSVFGRLAPGVSMDQAQAELAGIGQRASAGVPPGEEIRPILMPYAQSVLSFQAPDWVFGVLLFICTLLLIGIAANVALLVYARTATRMSEMTVRAALGASRFRIVGQLVAEAFVLSALAAAAGLVLTRIGLGLLLRQLEISGGWTAPFWMRREITPAVVVYAAGLAALTAAVVGALPGMQATAGRLRNRLSLLGRGTSLRLGGTWTTLVVAQVAIALCTMSAAAGFAWNLVGRVATRPTFAPEEFLLVRLSPATGQDMLDGARFAAVQREVARRLAAEPGVVSVSFAGDIPGPQSDRRVEMEIRPGGDPSGAVPGGAVGVDWIDPDYLEALGVRLLQGRALSPGDVASGTPVLVNEAFVERIVGGGSALGLRFHYPRSRAGGGADTLHEIVGVVANVAENRFDDQLVTPAVYHPSALGETPVTFALRVRGSTPASILPRVRDVVTGIDPSSVLYLEPLDARLKREYGAAALLGVALGGVFLSILLLSGGGVYALMSFTVTRRQRETGIRAAVGASRAQLFAAIFSRAAGQLAAGLVCGVAIVLLLDRAAAGNLLFGNGYIVIPAFVLLMAAAGLAATAGPARRAWRIQPVDALRAE